MYRIQGSCRRHTNYQNVLTLLLRRLKWHPQMVDGVCRFEVTLESMTDVKLAKQSLEAEVKTLERQIKPAIGYNIQFSNAYWVDA